VKQLEADRSDFMHALSHDMRNPLTSIIGYVQVMERSIPADEAQRTYLGRIRMSADRMLEMVNQLLQTVDSDTVEKLDRQPADLVKIVSSVIQDVEGVALGKEIKVKYRQEGEPYPVLVDETRLYHAILNLVQNAVKYSPEESEVQVSLTFYDEETVLRVIDQGPGIPQDEIDFIFEKYYRGSTNQPGSGLGLSVVRSIVNAHAGSVSAGNGVDGGAVFTLTLPASARLPDSIQPAN
jgi:signal transduction histidine kinase